MLISSNGANAGLAGDNMLPVYINVVCGYFYHYHSDFACDIISQGENNVFWGKCRKCNKIHSWFTISWFNTFR